MCVAGIIKVKIAYSSVCVLKICKSFVIRREIHALCMVAYSAVKRAGVLWWNTSFYSCLRCSEWSTWVNMSVTNKNICFFVNCETIIEKARFSKENEHISLADPVLTWRGKYDWLVLVKKEWEKQNNGSTYNRMIVFQRKCRKQRTKVIVPHPKTLWLFLLESNQWILLIRSQRFISQHLTIHFFRLISMPYFAIEMAKTYFWHSYGSVNVGLKIYWTNKTL